MAAAATAAPPRAEEEEGEGGGGGGEVVQPPPVVQQQPPSSSSAAAIRAKALYLDSAAGQLTAKTTPLMYACSLRNLHAGGSQLVEAMLCYGANPRYDIFAMMGSTYLPYLPTYLRLPTYGYLPTYLPTYLSTYLPTYLSTPRLKDEDGLTALQKASGTKKRTHHQAAYLMGSSLEVLEVSECVWVDR